MVNWDRLKFVFDKEQRDYSYFQKDNVSVFIYGYPFNDTTCNWVSANDLYKLYLRNELDFVEDIEGVYAIVNLDKTKLSILERYTT